MNQSFQGGNGFLFRLKRLSLMGFFFAGNAGISLVVFISIFGFLALEAIRFFPGYHQSLVLYRKSGQEYVGYLIEDSKAYQQIASLANQAYYNELDSAYATERGIVESFQIIRDALESGEGANIIAELKRLQNDKELVLAKRRWQEHVGRVLDDFDRDELDPFSRLSQNEDAWSLLFLGARSYDPASAQLPPRILEVKNRLDHGMKDFLSAKVELERAGDQLKTLRDRLTKLTMEIRDDAEMTWNLDPKNIEEFPFAERVSPVMAAKADHESALKTLEAGMESAITKLPSTTISLEATELLKQVRVKSAIFLERIDQRLYEADNWRWDRPVGLGDAVTGFFFGSKWISNSSWHSVYGLLPLLTGSVIVSVIAMVVAVPFSIGAALYVSFFSNRFERVFLKPVIEMIQAVPSVVWGFFGIVVLGELLMQASQIPLLAWFPGFPITERLNMLNAGLLLALMAVPTIFTLSKDAINRVPQNFLESSLALGASKIQTVGRIILPAAMSGIVGSILLGLGKVIGETMVVLLVAGNRISLPKWADGLGAIMQPGHTMTGIIGQEMGEVSPDTLHYRALCLVGLVLFMMSLGINHLAQKIVKRFGRYD